MKSSFFEFNVAITGLYTARAGLETVSHNISNANTRGYSRQVALIKANTPLSLHTGRGMVGTGSQAYSVVQIRDFYLDKKYWNGMATLGEYNVKRSQLSLTQTILSELEGTGLSTQFNNFFDSIQDLITNTGDATYRNSVIQSAESLTTFLKDTYEAFVKQQKDINEEVKAVVATINNLGTQIHTLNEKIRIAEAAGDNANDLRDQRATLVDDLSKYINVEVSEVDYGDGDKRFFVKINGQDFVMNNNLRLLSVRDRTYETDNVTKAGVRNAEDIAAMYDIYWGDSNHKFDMYSETLSGELKGLIDLRDGNNGNYAKFSYPAGAYDAATGELTVDLSLLSRYDLAASGGVLTLTDGTTGQIVELTYDSYDIDNASGTATFKLAWKDATEKGKIDTYFGRLEAGGGTVEAGKTTDYKGIPYYLSRLNNLARTFASAINFGLKLNGEAVAGVTGHINGWNLNEEQGDPPTLFFTYRDPITGEYVNYNAFDNGGGYSIYTIYNITANNLYVNPELLTNPRLLNASSTQTGGVDNNQVLLSMLRINTDDTLFSEGKLLDYIIGMTGELAIDVKQATNFETNYSTLTVQVDNQRLSVMGVSINEEMVDMIRFNQQYQAASRLINIIDGIYDTLCNRLGLL